MGERWKGLLNAFCGQSNTRSKVMASLCCSRETGSLLVPSANAIFLMGDRVGNTGNDVIERLSQLDTIASLLVSKLGATVNVWVIEPSHYYSNFACYQNLIPSLTASGEPMGYSPKGFPAAGGLLSLQLDCFAQVKAELQGAGKVTEKPALFLEDNSPGIVTEAYKIPRTVLLGFSKGGVVLNQLLAEFASLKGQEDLDQAPSDVKRRREDKLQCDSAQNLVPNSAADFLRSIEEIHCVDVGLNCRGAYLTDPQVLEAVAKVAANRPNGLKVTLHGTPRQWKDPRRRWIAIEKDRCVSLLKNYASKFGNGKLKVAEKLYFPQDQPSLQMHFQIIESLIMT